MVYTTVGCSVELASPNSQTLDLSGGILNVLVAEVQLGDLQLKEHQNLVTGL